MRRASSSSPGKRGNHRQARRIFRTEGWSLRPFLSQISGVFPNVNTSFQGVVDVIGGKPPAGFLADSIVQTDLMSLNPGKLILELPGASRDYGVTTVIVTIPSDMNCPARTVQVP